MSDELQQAYRQLYTAALAVVRAQTFTPGGEVRAPRQLMDKLGRCVRMLYAMQGGNDWPSEFSDPLEDMRNE